VGVAANVVVSNGTTVRWVMKGPYSVVSGRPGYRDSEWAGGPDRSFGTCPGDGVGVWLTGVRWGPDQFDSGTPGSKPFFEHTFVREGVFPFYCRRHSGVMQGQVTVLASRMRSRAADRRF
jgi:plastocyanin